MRVCVCMYLKLESTSTATDGRFHSKYSLIMLWVIKWRLASVLKIEKCRHTDTKNSKLGGKIRNRFFW